VCGQPVYRFGRHADLWNAAANKNANWHCACVIAWEFWNAPSAEAPVLRCKPGGVAKRVAGSGRMLISITRSRYFASGMTIAMKNGQSCSTFGAYQILESSIAMPTLQNPPSAVRFAPERGHPTLPLISLV
jgi:hypothetical protein